MKRMPAPLLTPQTLATQAGRVCVAVAGEDMVAVAQQSLAECRFFEFRLDSATDPAFLLPAIATFLEANPGSTAIATCRRTAYGGGFPGTSQQQLSILTEAAAAGCRLVDMETETAEELGTPALQQLRAAGAAVILSWHDFEGTPALPPQVERMAPFAPDFCKIVPTARTLRDALALIDLLETHGADGRLIAMSMGFRGTLTRVLGPRFGSAFTFAAPENGAGTAPGQISIRTVRDLYRIDSISAQTAIYAVTGQPISGSLSPRMHNFAFATLGMDAVYLPLETDDPAELQEVIARLKIQGLSVTMPLKETVLPLLATTSHAVQQMKACNTLVRSGESFAGHNTDVPGITGPLEGAIPLQGARVLILGAGGAARAAVFGLRDAGAEVFITNRTQARAEALAAEADVYTIPREQLAAKHFDIIVNTTPYGMKNQSIDAPISAHEMNAEVFFDLVYNPVETPLIQLAKQRGLKTIAGVEMFVEQGVRQFELWTGIQAPRDAMQQAVLDALK